MNEEELYRRKRALFQRALNEADRRDEEDKEKAKAKTQQSRKQNAENREKKVRTCLAVATDQGLWVQALRGAATMRKLLMALIVLVPITASAGNTAKVDELKAAEEDICMAKLEYADAKILFYSETSGQVDMNNSYQVRYYRDYQRKSLRYGQLLQRFARKYGKQFDAICTASGKVYHPTKAEKEALDRAMAQRPR